MQKTKLFAIFLLGLTMLAFTKLPFAEAETFLRDKVNLPTKAYDDLKRGMHSRAFVVAGAMKNELLADIRQEVDSAIANGTTLADFKKNFTTIIERRGWKGSARSPVDTPRRVGWRAGVIFNTNLRTAYAAGHFQQSQLVRESRPFWRYVGGLSGDPRPLHLAWSGTILPANHPWFNAHYPPNGWGCKCKIVTVSRSELKRRGLTGPTRQPTPVSSTAGIDKGWDYNPGRAAFGEASALRSIKEFKKEKRHFTILNPGRKSASEIKFEKISARPDEKIKSSKMGMESAIEKVLGGKERIFSFQSGDFRYDFNVNAKALAGSLSDTPDRARFIPLILDIAESPFEIWQAFERNEKTGKVVLRHRFIKAVETEKDRGVVMIFDSSAGKTEALTFFPVRKNAAIKELDKRRRGKLIFKRKQA